MKIFKLSIFAFLLLGISILNSCKLDDQPDPIYLAMGNVVGDSPSTFLIKTDGGMILKPIEYPDSYKTIKDGTRVLAYYKNVNAGREDQDFDYTIRVQSIQNVLTKEIMHVNEEGRDTLAHDPIRIIDVWIGKSYLNIEFSFYAHEKVHAFDLLLDPEEQEKDGFVTLDFHHDSREDKQYYNFRGLISFDVSELQQENADSIKIFFRADDEYFSPREIIYKYGLSQE